VVLLLRRPARGGLARVPEIPTGLSLSLVVGVLATVTATSLLATRRSEDREPAKK
jgi:tellurite resistance protein TerC